MTTITLSLPCTNPYFLSSSPKRFRFNTQSAQLSPSSSSPLQSPPLPKTTGVIVIGAGLAGLAAATHLNSQNIPFLLDRGFQIFITAYPEAQKLLNYQSLNLQKFYSGARIFYDGQFHTVADPLRHFWDSARSLTNPIGSPLDKLLIGSTRIRALVKSDEEILTAEEVPTIELLKKLGFSDSIIRRFFRPFFGGIFFDPDLETTSRLFNFIFKCLALGDNTLPARGISAIPEQLAARLPSGSILLNSKAVSVDLDNSDSPLVRLQNGDVLKSELGVIVAVEEPAAVHLLSGRTGPVPKKPVRSTVCLYFTANRDQIPVPDPVLFLNGSGKGIVNNMFFVTNVAPSFGPPDKGLVSVSLIGLFEGVSDEELVGKVVNELSGWFGEKMVSKWNHLRTYRIGFAQPNQCPPTDLKKDPRVESGLYVCGDHLTSATFDGALVSGRRAAESLLKDRALTAA
ncbi:uncharacterized protein [Glycine max]|uniref:uncharacterized protein isoform X2 n=1 Tax=Glycine max TaxID=3847 RepID=UPI001B356202|nr:uncharacterized protein LOC100812558 isoform X2 [Glycine max]